MGRMLIAMLLAGGGAAGASSVALNEMFGEGGFNLDAIFESATEVGPMSLGVLVLPVLFYFLSGVFSYVTSVVVLAAAAAAVLKFYVGVETPLEALAIVCGIGSAVAVGVYRIIT